MREIIEILDHRNIGLIFLVGQVSFEASPDPTTGGGGGSLVLDSPHLTHMPLDGWARTNHVKA